MENDQNRINELIVIRDARNFPMSRKELISLISDVAGVSICTAQNHWNYLVCTGQLKDLKRNGKTVCAQKTTTKRSQVTAEQQMRWHYVVEHEWDKQRELNLPKEEFISLHAHFHGNLDESCILVSEGNVKVVSSIFLKQKRTWMISVDQSQ